MMTDSDEKKNISLNGDSAIYHLFFYRIVIYLL